MRLTLVLALALAGTMTAAAQTYDKPKAKPLHKTEKEAKSQTTVKAAPLHSSTAQELRRIEQTGAKASTHKAEAGKAAHSKPVVKAEKKKDTNPPIRLAAGGNSGHGGKGNKENDSSKGRLRHKGSH